MPTTVTAGLRGEPRGEEETGALRGETKLQHAEKASLEFMKGCNFVMELGRRQSESYLSRNCKSDSFQGGQEKDRSVVLGKVTLCGEISEEER